MNRQRRERFRIRLCVERLEERCVLSPWPIAPTNQAKPLLTTYGQYVEGGSIGIRFHEGIDVVAPAGTEIRAVQAGTVAGVHRNPIAYESYLVSDSGNQTGWNVIV